MSHAHFTVRVTAAAAVSLLLPFGLATASAAAPTSKAKPRAVSKLPPNIQTAGSLRSLDAIQLACAIAVAKGLGDELIFVTADARLGTIAPLEGFRVVNPLYPPQI